MMGAGKNFRLANPSEPLEISRPTGIIFPRAFAVAIDDLGWNKGSHEGASGGPFRLCIRRDMDIRDYRPIVEVGQACGIRIQGLFVLCEMDRQNVCARYPTTTQHGKNFDNAENIGPTQLEVMEYVRDNAAYLEFGLHGVGHEHWENGIRTRAEWYDKINDKSYPEDDTRDHIQCFKEIMAQYGWTPENGQSFPESFVPGSYAMYWNPEGEYSTGKILREHGVKYANTMFSEIPELNPPEDGGMDHGLHVINRLIYGNEYKYLGKVPQGPVESFRTDVIESHWPNWLAVDDYLQPALTREWIDFYKNIQASHGHYLAKNTEQLHSQWLYKKYTLLSEIKGGVIAIDNRQMPSEVYENGLLGNMVLKVPLNDGEHVSKALLNGITVPAYFEEAGYGFMYLPPLESNEYLLEYETGNSLMPVFVNNTGTYNVYSADLKKEEAVFRIRMYGTQEVNFRCGIPDSVCSDNPYLKVLSWKYEAQNRMLTVKMNGRDMQGETGNIKICLT
jgi:hypothetical protein